MSLTTTMGIELTYVPACYDTALQRGANFEPTVAVPGEDDMVNALARVLRLLVKAKKIPAYRGVYTDPGCVEVATKPYKTLSRLLSVAKRIRVEAEAIGLATQATYSGGGGAHVHTGVIGKTDEEREAYKRRMLVFAAHNPWIAWACSDVVDNCNAQPICREDLIDTYSLKYRIEELEQEVKEYSETLERYTSMLHRGDVWSNERERERMNHHIRNYRRWRNTARVSLINFRKQINTSPNDIPLGDIKLTKNKDQMVRITDYGRQGTVEFRMFEMGDEAKLERNILLANAICSYVERQDFTRIDRTTLPAREAVRAMTAEQAQAGWLGMLRALGLDPADYADETAQIARRAAHWAASGKGLAGD